MDKIQKCNALSENEIVGMRLGKMQTQAHVDQHRKIAVRLIQGTSEVLKTEYLIIYVYQVSKINGK